MTDSGAVNILPLALFLVMFAVGLALRGDDFRGVLQRPALVAAGLGMQLLLLPLTGWLVVSLWPGIASVLALPDLTVTMTAGLMIITFAPGGVTSNLLCLLCKADTALSVSLTVLSGLVVPFSLPWLSYLTLEYLDIAAVTGAFPVGTTIAKLLFIGVLPVLLGMLCRYFWPEICERWQRRAKWLGTLIMLLTVVMLVNSSASELWLLSGWVFLPVCLLVCLAMSLSYTLARGMGWSLPAGLTLAIETGIQNAGTGLVLSAVILQNDEISAVILFYGVLMQLPAAGLIIWRNFPAFKRVFSEKSAF